MVTYTSNIGIEQPGVGEQTNTWGNTVNDNMDILDRVTSQVGSIALTTTSYTLTTSDAGVVSEGHYSIIKFTGSPGGTCTVTINPNDIQRIYTIINSTDQTVTMTQGTGGNVSIPSGNTTVVYCDGVGAGSAVTDVSASLSLSDVNITGGSIDGTPIGASTASTGNFSTLSIGGTAITSTATELNVLDGITATTTELNYTDGVTSNIQTQLDTKAPTAGATFTGTTEIATLSLNSTAVTSTAAELNVLDGITATTTELNYTDGVTSNIQTQLDAKAPTASPTFTGTVTMTGANATVKEVTETVYAVSGTSPALDPGNGTIQTWTLTGNSTPTDSFSAGQSMTLMVNDGTAYSITWPTMTWVNNGGSEPTLATSGYTVVVLWKVGSTLYGALVGDGT